MNRLSFAYSLMNSREVDASLQYTTTMSMSGYFHAILTNSVINKLFILARKSMQTFLNNMVSIDILDQHNHNR